jgi:hypothetical protein
LEIFGDPPEIPLRRLIMIAAPPTNRLAGPPQTWIIKMNVPGKNGLSSSEPSI